MKKSYVYVIKSDLENVYSAVEKLIEMTGGIEREIKKKIIIKINLCDARTPETGAITHPLFLDALLRFLRESFDNLKILVVESDATVVLADKFIKWFGFVPILEKWGAEWVNLSKVDKVVLEIDKKYLRKIHIPQLFFDDVYFISLAKLKTNILTKITCVLKNQFGCLGEVEKNIYHPYIDDIISEINYIIKPNLSLVDGIISMGGAQGPAFGIPISSNLIIGGKDPVAVDAYCAEVLGFKPYFVGHIRKSYLKGIGSIKYEVIGDKIDKIDFEINRFEMVLFRWGSYFKKKFMEFFRKG